MCDLCRRIPTPSPHGTFAIVADENTPRNMVPNLLQLAERTGQDCLVLSCAPCALSHLPVLMLAAAWPWKTLLLQSVVPQETDRG